MSRWPASAGVGLAVDSVDALDTPTYVVEVDLDGPIHWSAGGSGDSSSLVPSDELDLLATDLISTPSNECSDGKHNLSSGVPRWTATPTWYIDLGRFTCVGWRFITDVG